MFLMLLTFILIIINIPSTPHCFIPGLKPFLSANPSTVAYLLFFRPDSQLRLKKSRAF